MKLMNKTDLFEKGKLYVIYGNYPNISVRVIYVFTLDHNYRFIPDQDMESICIYHGVVYHNDTASIIISDELVGTIVLLGITPKEIEIWELTDDEEEDMMVVLV